MPNNNCTCCLGFVQIELDTVDLLVFQYSIESLRMMAIYMQYNDRYKQINKTN